MTLYDLYMACAVIAFKGHFDKKSLNIIQWRDLFRTTACLDPSAEMTA